MLVKIFFKQLFISITNNKSSFLPTVSKLRMMKLRSKKISNQIGKDKLECNVRFDVHQSIRTTCIECFWLVFYPFLFIFN